MNLKIETILNALNQTPRILHELIHEIDDDLHTEKIIPGKWSIHEHATHVAVGDLYDFQKRLVAFKNEVKPIFQPLSEANFDKDFFLNLDLHKSVEGFYKIRQETIQNAKEFSSEDWY
jgi:hypothetical protein